MIAVEMHWVLQKATSKELDITQNNRQRLIRQGSCK